jgi:hypothetical protein
LRRRTGPSLTGDPVEPKRFERAVDPGKHHLVRACPRRLLVSGEDSNRLPHLGQHLVVDEVVERPVRHLVPEVESDLDPEADLAGCALQRELLVQVTAILRGLGHVECLEVTDGRCGRQYGIAELVAPVDVSVGSHLDLDGADGEVEDGTALVLHETALLLARHLDVFRSNSTRTCVS